jgi:hypothetical protein
MTAHFETSVGRL